jgi:hypothetical protein
MDRKMDFSCAFCTSYRTPAEAHPLGTVVNILFEDRTRDVLTLEVEDPGSLGYLDTPEDYSRWRS